MQAIPMVRKWKADAIVAVLIEKERAMEKERAKVQDDKASQERLSLRLSSLRSSLPNRE